MRLSKPCEPAHPSVHPRPMTKSQSRPIHANRRADFPKKQLPKRNCWGTKGLKSLRNCSAELTKIELALTILR